MKFFESGIAPCVEKRKGFHGKFSIKLDLTKDGIQRSFYYFLPEYFEEDTQRYLRTFLKPGMAAIDLGAHIGFYTLLMADLVGQEGRVYSFEPEKNNFAKLKENIALNNLFWVQLFKMAVSDKDGDSLLYLNKENDVAHSLILESANAANAADSENVSTVSLDNFAKQERISRIDLIKIDAEGAEAMVLEGGRNIFLSENAPSIICETQPTEGRPGGKKDTAREILYDYGYKSYRLETKYLEELCPKDQVAWVQNVLYLKNNKEISRERKPNA